MELAPRRVRVYGIDLLRSEYPRLAMEVRCGRGTYIRSLARDLGERLGCGGYIQSLRRTRVGPFIVEDALPLDADGALVLKKVLPLAAAVSELPRVTLDEGTAEKLRHGQDVAAPVLDAGEVAVFDVRGGLVAVARIERGLLHADKVFPAGVN
jgi:tRNA pseudouridine55 synthase